MSRTLGSALVCCSLACCSLLAALAADSLGQEPYPRPNDAEAKIEAALGETAKLDFADQPLADVVEALAKQHKIPIQVDYKALTDEGFGSDTPVTAHIEGVSLRSALRLVLGQFDLTYVVRNEVLFVTTKTEAENMLIFKVYPVGDLVRSENEFRSPPTPEGGVGEDYQSLIELITSCVAPTTWDEVGGPGSIQEFRHSHALAFSQMADVHEEVASLLAALRQARHKQRLAAKLLAKATEKPQPAEVETTNVKVYRLDLPPAMPGGMGGMGGVGMGGGGGFFAFPGEPAASDKVDGGKAAGNNKAMDDKLAGENAPPHPGANPVLAPAQAPAAGAPRPIPAAVSAPAAPPKLDSEQLDRWAKEIAEILPEVIAPESWAPKGEGFVRFAAGSLVIQQTDATHRKIEQFLAQLLIARSNVHWNSFIRQADQATPPLAVPGPQVDWPQEAEPARNAREIAIDKALDSKLDLSFVDTPLADVIQFFRQRTQLDIQVDAKALADAGLGMDAPVTWRLAGVSLRAALRLLLDQLDLTYVTRNEVLMITTKTESENMLTCKVYPVFDLVVRPSNAAPRGRAVDYQSLIEGLTSTIAPTSWDEVGGPGAIQEYINAGALVISQTTEVHEEIASYLRALREVSAEQK